jgi:hypothetical protein
LTRAPEIDVDRKPLWRRLAWMAAIWAGSVAALGAVAFCIRLALA